MRRTWIGVVLLSWGSTAFAQDSDSTGAAANRGIGGGAGNSAAAYRSEYPRSYGKYHALLIGVGDYPGKLRSASGRVLYPALDTPVKDVTDLARQLAERLDWNVRMLKDAEVTSGKLREQLQEYARTLGPHDNLFVWYAGHGERGRADKDWSWILHDEQPFRFADSLEDLLLAIPVRHLLVVSDSCFAAVRSDDTFHRTGLEHLNRLERTPSRQIITSGDVEAVADQGVYRRTGERSPFASAFLQFIEGMNAETRPMTAWEAFALLRPEAMKNASEGQVPRCGFMTGDARTSGQFFFVHPDFYASERMREDARKRMRIAAGQWAELIQRGSMNGHAVYHHRDVRRDRDEEPMVLVEKTYVEPGEGRAEPVEPFLIDLHEVTVRQFKAFLASSGDRRGPRYLTARGYNGDDQPIVGVTLGQALAYAHWAGKTLPDESQWLAAAALHWVADAEGAERIVASEYPWSESGADLAADLLWVAYPPPVTAATQDISPWGVERMGSGVREWCLRTDRALGLGVVRGGSVVRTSSRDTRASWKSDWREESRGDIPRANVGFRCIVPLRGARGEGR